MKYLYGLLLCCLGLSACHVFRAIVYLGPDTGDKNIMPKSVISKSPKPLPFGPNTNNISKAKKDFISQYIHPRTDAFVIIENDTIIYEYYSKGHDKSSLFIGFSISKSFVATLLGIAIDEGYIKNTGEKLIQYIPEFKNADPSLQNLSIQQLLDMRSGIVVDEHSIGLNTHMTRMYYGKNINRELFKLRSADSSRFVYQNINTQILLLIIERATGRKFQDYFRDKLWHPIGAEYDAQWIIDDHKNQTPKAYFGMIATAYDFAKLGRLYLHNGSSNGAQVVSGKWVNACNNMDTLFRYRYKNHWWANNLEYLFDSDSSAKAYLSMHHLNATVQISGSRHGITLKGDAFVAEGLFEQYIYVYPGKNLIIVRLGDETKDDRKAMDKLITTLGNAF